MASAYRGAAASGTGVFGASLNGFGIGGKSTSRVGVRGESASGTGVYGASTSSSAVYGVCSGVNAGVYGSSGSGYSAYGNATSGTGVVGASTSGWGVYGTSSSAIGVFGYCPSPSGYAGYFQGNFVVVNGPKNALVPHPDGSHRRMYCMESPDSWFEDVGTGTLAGGRADVRLDSDFAAVVKSDAYEVFLTSGGDCRGLYVASKAPNGFTVRELQAGTSGVPFSYRVIAKRKDIPAPRLEKVTLPKPIDPKDLPKAPDAPTLPGTEPTSPPSPAASPMPTPAR